MKYILALIIMLTVLTSCDNCKDECRQQYSYGYDQGEDDGYREGYKDGKKNGFEEGRIEGEKDGFEEGQREGYIKGTKTFIEGRYLLSLGGSLILAFFSILLISFIYFFHKSIGHMLYETMQYFHNLYSFITIKRKVKTLEEYQDRRANIISKTSCIEMYIQLNSQLNEMKYERECFLFLTKIEMYLTKYQLSHQYVLNDIYIRASRNHMNSDVISQSERGELLSMVKKLLRTKLSDIQNIMKYEYKSYEKIKSECDDYYFRKKLYIRELKLKRLMFIFSIIMNIVLFIGIILYFIFQIF